MLRTVELFGKVACAAALAVASCVWAEDQKAPAKPSVARSLLLIVTPQRFEEDLRPYIEHRRGDMTVEVAALETVLKSNPGVDDPEKLKRFLYRAWKQKHVRYVLLVGDASLVPVRYMVLDRVTPPAYDYAFYPSDLYYADLAKPDGSFEDWNARKDGFHAGYFGEVRGEKNKNDPINFDQIDYRPEVGVGRWPVNSAEQLRTLVAKTIAFEKRVAAVPKESPRAALIAVSGWVDSRRFMDRMATTLPSNWTIEKRYDGERRQKSPTTPPATTPPVLAGLPTVPPRPTTPPTEKEVIGLLNGGLDLVVHAGHGSDTRWERCFFMRDLDQVHNAKRLPVMISAGCSTARFATLPPYEAYVDVRGVEHKGTNAGEVFKEPPPPPATYQRGRFSPPGLGKQLLVAGPDGAVAYFGCNTGSQPCGLTLVEGFVRAWSQDKDARLGDCWAEAVRYYYDKERLAQLKPTADWYPPSIFFQGMKFMLFGDPSLRLPH